MSADAAQTKQKKLAGKELKEAIKRQVEFYFSRANLANDAFLVSQMNSQMYVPVDVIIGFAKIQQLTNSVELLVEAIADSQVVSLSEAKDAIKPNIKSERNTIILREIPSATAPEEVKAIFEGCGDVSVRSDVGDTWFVTLASEDDAVKTLLALRSKTFNGAPIKARLKSENLLKSFYPTQAPEPVVAASGLAAGGAYARGYYAAGPGYYDMPNNYGVQYASGHRGGQFNGAHRGGRGGAAGQQQFRGPHQGGRGANAPQQGKEPRQKSGSFDQQRPASRKAKDKKAKAAAAAAAAATATGAPAAPQSNGSTKKHAGDRQPVLNAANFPPLPTSDKPAEAPQYGEIKHKYAHEDILEIVKHMDEDDCKLPEGKMDYEAHAVALTPIAHPDLLRNQRTYSIEQAREAMRQGRPIRSDSIGSVDYESMMYGEDYTKEARELRKQKAEAAATTGADKPAAAAAVAATEAGKAPATKPSSPATGKVLGYAAAVINGTPAPQPPLESAKPKKPTTPAAAGAAAAAKAKTPKGKDEKKPAKKATKEAAVDETLPKTGVWGGRNFLDVVKSEPPNPPPAPVKPTTPAAGAGAPGAPTTPSGAKKPENKDKKEQRRPAPATKGAEEKE